VKNPIVQETELGEFLSHIVGGVCVFGLRLSGTVPLCDSKLFISRSCPILVLTTVMGRPRRADVEKDVKNYQGPKKALLSRF
jgi:hypothetical protein